jgi:hypothetical protein
LFCLLFIATRAIFQVSSDMSPSPVTGLQTKNFAKQLWLSAVGGSFTYHTSVLLWHGTSVYTVSSTVGFEPAMKGSSNLYAAALIMHCATGDTKCVIEN